MSGAHVPEPSLTSGRPLCAMAISARDQALLPRPLHPARPPSLPHPPRHRSQPLPATPSCGAAIDGQPSEPPTRPSPPRPHPINGGLGTASPRRIHPTTPRALSLSPALKSAASAVHDLGSSSRSPQTWPPLPYWKPGIARACRHHPAATGCRMEPTALPSTPPASDRHASRAP